MLWYFACPFIYLFLFKTNGKKGHLKRTNSVTVMAIFFESGILKVTWSQLCLNFLLNNYEAYWQKQFERCPTVAYFTDMDQHSCYIFHQVLGKHNETKINEDIWKYTSSTKIRACTSKNIAPKQTMFHLFYTLLCLAYLVFKFNLFIFIYLFIYIFAAIYLPFHQSFHILLRLYTFL